MARTTKVLESVQSAGLKLNKDKCKFEVTATAFLGHKISGEGVEADPSKIQAILNMPEPTSKKELQRFLGIITYLGKFIPNLSDLTALFAASLRKMPFTHLTKDRKKHSPPSKLSSHPAQSSSFLIQPYQYEYRQMHPVTAA